MRQEQVSPIAVALLAACLQAGPGVAEETPAPVRLQALAAMEALQEELQVLSSLRGAQAAMLAWNRESVRTGAAPQALPPSLCRDPAIAAWCPLLPATFGRAATEDGHD